MSSRIQLEERWLCFGEGCLHVLAYVICCCPPAALAAFRFLKDHEDRAAGNRNAANQFEVRVFFLGKPLAASPLAARATHSLDMALAENWAEECDSIVSSQEALNHKVAIAEATRSSSDDESDMRLEIWDLFFSQWNLQKKRNNQNKTKWTKTSAKRKTQKNNNNHHHKNNNQQAWSFTEDFRNLLVGANLVESSRSSPMANSKGHLLIGWAFAVRVSSFGGTTKDYWNKRKASFFHAVHVLGSSC